MNPIAKLSLFALGMTLSLVTIVALVGERIDAWLSTEQIVALLRERPGVGWLLAVGLLMADLFLPIPAPTVITGLGTVYGATLGALLGATGLASVGLVGYGIAHLGGERAARRIASDTEMRRFRAWFDRWGVLAIVLTRMLPILPEVLSVLAGLVGMSFRRYAVALSIGCIPVGILFAWLGERFIDQPGIGFGLGFAIPLALWGVLRGLGLIGPEPAPSDG